MSALTSRGIAYATNCTVAALLALLVAFSIGIANPWWAALTVFIVSQPLAGASGAVVSRGLYRMAGTALGVAASLAIVPLFADEPLLLILATSAWIGLCLYVSLIDRSPRSYTFMLAGYTVALVGLPAVTDPSSVFDIAIARTEEITIGAACAALMHSLIRPRTVRSLVEARVAATLKDARQWILDSLSSTPTAASQETARRRLAVDLSELNQLGHNLRFDLASARTRRRTLWTLEDRLVALLPLLTAVDDRLSSLRSMETAEDGLAACVEQARRWVAEGGDAAPLLSRLADLEHELADASTAPPARQLVSINLVRRLIELVQAWDECIRLEASLRNAHPTAVRTPTMARASQEKRHLHVDHALAAFFGAAAAIAVASAAGLAALLGWPQGIAVAGIAAAGSSVFAFIDDPRPMQRILLRWTLIAIPISALYVFAILPAIDGFVALAVALSPLYFTTALFLATPSHWLKALGFALVSHSLISLQAAHRGDLYAFSSLAISAVLGAIVALLATALIRVVGADVSAWRILRAGWRDLAALADGSRPRPRHAWASLMLDRAAMLLPRLAQATGDERLRLADALNDLRVGAGLVELRDASSGQGAGASWQPVEQMLGRIAEHFRAQVGAGHHAPTPSLLASVDAAIHFAFRLADRPTRAKALAALSGLRRGLFPDAAPYVQPGVEHGA